MSKFTAAIPARRAVHIETTRIGSPDFTQYADIYVDNVLKETLTNEVALYIIPDKPQQRTLEIQPRWSGSGGSAGLSSWTSASGMPDLNWTITCDDGWLDGRPDFKIAVAFVTVGPHFVSPDRADSGEKK